LEVSIEASLIAVGFGRRSSEDQNTNVLPSWLFVRNGANHLDWVSSALQQLT
jgi:hypothetical protein